MAAAATQSTGVNQNIATQGIQMDLKWRESTFYKEALENMVQFNGHLKKERRSRVPYIDAQTGIAQRDCNLWHQEHERMKGLLPGQIYSYPSQRWRLEASPVFTTSPNKSSTEQPMETTPTGSSGLVQTVEGGVVTKRSSRIAGLKKEDSVLTVTTGSRVSLESPISSEINDEESDADFVDDYDSEEERKQQKKKRKSTRSTRSNTSSITTSRHSSTNQEKEKPFVCSVCNRRYKTQSSLKAHQTQYHAGDQATGGEVEKKEELGPPASKKKNPYCDFCLGDDVMNHKSGKHERMVSCADCGRSGHPSCLQFSPALAAVVVTYRWQCIECKSCSLCGKSDNDDQLLFCDDCDRGYHMYCLKPPMKEAPEGSWSCGMCKTIR